MTKVVSLNLVDPKTERSSKLGTQIPIFIWLLDRMLISILLFLGSPAFQVNSLYLLYGLGSDPPMRSRRAWGIWTTNRFPDGEHGSFMYELAHYLLQRRI